MVILHIACIENYPFSGVCVVVPQHVNAQSKFAEIAFINVNNEKIENINKQFEYIKPFNISQLPKPYDRPDLVVFQECYRIEYVQIARNLRKNKIPYVIVPHGELNEDAQKKKHLKKTVANILLFNDFINHALAVQCLSQRECDNTNFGRKKIIATNGMYVPAVQKKDFSSQGLKFLYIGRQDAYHKGLDLMIEAFRMKASFLREHNCTLEIYGPDCNGSVATLAEFVQNADVGDIVKQYGPISGKEKEEKLLECDIFIQTSRFEGMPLGVLEAMSYGIPCLVTEGTTLGSYFEETVFGWLAETSSASIADTIEKAFFQKKLYGAMGQSGKTFIENEFSWERIASETVRKYKELIDTP